MNALDTLPVASAFPARLRAWRQSNRFDLDAAAHLLGVSGNFLYTIERGVYPPSGALVERFEQALRGSSIFTEPAVLRRIPILSWVQAGRASSYEEMPSGWMDWLDCVCPDPKAFAVRVVGESMLPQYPPGNLAVCMPSFPPKNNGLAVAKIRDECATFKKIKFKGKQPARFRLIPLNPEYAATSVQRADLLWIYPVHSVLNPCRS
jgi:SOS-response transcriptional repressor LexA